MSSETIVSFVGFFAFFVPTYISLCRESEYSAIILLLMTVAIFILFELGLVFCCYGVNGIKYVCSGNNLLEIWTLLWSGASEIASHMGCSFKNSVKEYVMLYGC